MDKATLLKKLDALLDEFDRTRMFGSVEIVIPLRACVNASSVVDRKNSKRKGEFPP